MTSTLYKVEDNSAGNEHLPQLTIGWPDSDVRIKQKVNLNTQDTNELINKINPFLKKKKDMFLSGHMSNYVLDTYEGTTLSSRISYDLEDLNWVSITNEDIRFKIKHPNELEIIFSQYLNI